MKKVFKKNPTTVLPFSLEKQLKPEKDSRFDLKFTKKKKEKKNLIKRKLNSKPVKKDKFSLKNDKKSGQELRKTRENLESTKTSKYEKLSKKSLLQKDLSNIEKFASLEKKNPNFAAFLASSNLINSTTQADSSELEVLRKKLKLKNNDLDRNFKQDGLDYLLDGFMGKDDQDESEQSNFGENGDEVEGEEGKYSGVVVSDEEDEFGLGEDLSDFDMDDSEGDSEMQVSGHDSQEDDFEEAQPEPRPSLYQPQEASTATAYVPPHLRPKPTDTVTVLRRQIQGLINKLSDPNMDSVVGSIQELLLSNPRNSITTVTIDIMLKLVSDHSNLLDTFCATYACFLACLNQVIGLEFGASFTQKVVEVYCHHKSLDGKISTNLAMLLAYLYSFNAVSYSLIYDLLKESIKDFKEIDVEILLKLLKIGGARLRKDDPGALKDIVMLIQSRVVGIPGLR